MTNYYVKKLISVCLIVILVTVSIIGSVAYADPVSIAVGGFTGLSGMGLFGSVSSFMGTDVVYSGNSEDPYNMMWSATESDPVTITVSETHKGTGQVGDEYDYIVIDSQGYNDIAQSVIDNWIHDNNITDFSSGTISSPQNYKGLPFNTPIGAVETDTSQTGTTYTIGTTSCYWTLYINSSNRGTYQLYVDGQPVGQSSYTSIGSGKHTYFLYLTLQGTPADDVSIGIRRDSNPYNETSNVIFNALEPATNIAWTSQEIDTTKGTDYTSPRIKIPSAISGLTPLFTAEDFIKVLSTIALAQNLSQVIIDDADTPPVPPTPVPTMPLGEVPYDEWIDTWGQHVIDNQETGNESLDNIDTNIQTGVDTLDNIDTNIEDGVDTLESIDTNIGTTNGILGQIKDLITSGFNSITSLLNQILTGVQSLVQSIVNATENLIAGILNQIPTVFQSAWNTIKQSVSIWHYVVEWVTSISSVLTWVWTMASGTSYYIILPVYASLAGAVVLALYKKFGR